MIPIYEKRNDIFSAYYSDNLTFPSHLHTHIEMLYVEEGEIEVTIGSGRQLLKEGEFAIAFPNRIHGYDTKPDYLSSRIILILCPVEMSGDFMPLLLKKHPVVPYLNQEILHKDVPYVMRSLLELSGTSDHIPVVRAYIQLILARILPHMELKLNRDTNPPGHTAQLITYLSEHYSESVSLDDLAIQLGISKYSVSRIFNEKLLTSFSTYINTLRVNYAKTLLQHTDKDILTISLMCGYENSRTFNREFKKICGLTPRDYRQEEKTKSIL